MFIIDPLSAEVANPGRRSAHMVNSFQDAICGVSQLPLSQTFGDNVVEHAMVMRFLCEIKSSVEFAIGSVDTSSCPGHRWRCN
jgi:hypothetical protein